MAEKQRVVRTDQSPLNPKRWCLTLVCGHEVWVTRTRRPSPQFFMCHDCARAEALAAYDDHMANYE